MFLGTLARDLKILYSGSSQRKADDDLKGRSMVVGYFKDVSFEITVWLICSKEYSF